MQNRPGEGSGGCPTFVIRIMRMENSSIQGYVRWLEQGKNVPFRSSLELFHLIEEGILLSGEEPLRLRSWDYSADRENGECGKAP